MQYLIRASPILPENVRMEILKKHTYVSTTEGLESAPSDILFAMIAKEYHDGLNEYSSATYPVQSLRDKNYEVCLLFILYQLVFHDTSSVSTISSTNSA